ncbi:MAG TPA: tRNA (adenosine(37)-N6)-dimethylallyltransferase MiaA [Steroidobacteraceae bacterium]|jgi:tRNA dimethylallyltransferase
MTVELSAAPGETSAATRKPVILLMGPTGAGKTDLAIGLAQRFPLEIVSVDSAMVYRGLDVGTGKPDAAMLRRFPHHLVDILDPAQSYSAGQFVRDARCVIDAVHGRGNIPLLVGGTMLYFRALRGGLAELPEADPSVRAQIDTAAIELGWPALHAQLAAIDPQAAVRIQPADGQRIQRALEVFRITGRTLSALHASAAPPPSDLAFKSYAWVPSDRERLYDAIAVRFDHMLRTGLLDEVRRLYERGDLHARMPAMRSVGYRQLWEYLEQKVSLDAAVANAILATRHLARRQLVWLRGENRAHDETKWIDALDSESSAQMQRIVAVICNDNA